MYVTLYILNCLVDCVIIQDGCFRGAVLLISQPNGLFVYDAHKLTPSSKSEKWDLFVETNPLRKAIEWSLGSRVYSQ